MIEIGIPFSDPMADGPVIQHAATRALKNGMTLKLLFDQLKDIRKEVQIPLVLMGYLNPIMQYGFKDFCRTCRETGIDGVIIPDLPFKDYMEEYRSIAEEQNVRIIMLITPETSEERIRLIDEHTDGFIYMVSSAAITNRANGIMISVRINCIICLGKGERMDVAAPALKTLVKFEGTREKNGGCCYFQKCKL